MRHITGEISVAAAAAEAASAPTRGPRLFVFHFRSSLSFSELGKMACSGCCTAICVFLASELSEPCPPFPAWSYILLVESRSHFALKSTARLLGWFARLG